MSLYLTALTSMRENNVTVWCARAVTETRSYDIQMMADTDTVRKRLVGISGEYHFLKNTA